ncbi:hypothetical protein C8Q74DRAFT_566264 [Fomes fomentarius]|nr:hypothetical protein C8Q74DRAFT_566264 [Fomes fomentarius]
MIIPVFPSILSPSGRQNMNTPAYPPPNDTASDEGAQAVTAAPRTASAPFNRASADFILRSSDQVDFHVWKFLLAEVSEFFGDLFIVGQPDEEAAAGNGALPAVNRVCTAPSKAGTPQLSKHVLDVPQDSTVLERLLLTFYPPPNIKFSSLDEMKPVIAAADFYRMGAVLDALKNELLAKYVADEPLRVYIIATRYGWDDVRTAAIRAFLTTHGDVADAHIHDLDDLNASAYHKILSYRRQYLAKLKDALRGLGWLHDGGWTFFCCTSSGCLRTSAGQTYTLFGSSSPRQPAVWFWSHYRVVERLLDWPSGKALEDPGVCEPALKEAVRCVGCRENVHEHLRMFMSQLGIRVETVFDEVSQTIT